MTMGDELDLRALRYFVAVAEELSFTRAAARSLVAQQALSRQIQGLERRLGITLFVRSTRRVSLTPEGDALLDRARQLLAMHDLILRDLRTPVRPLIVDLLVVGPRTGMRVVETAMAHAPHLEIRRRYSGGMGAAIPRLLNGEVDVACGRAQSLGQDLPHGLEPRLARLAPIGLLLPLRHRLAARSTVPMEALSNLEVDAGVGHPGAPEWHDFARQLIAFTGARPTATHVPPEGHEDTAEHLNRQGLPILVEADHVPIEGGVVRPLVDPLPLYPWSVVYRRDAHPGVGAILQAIEVLNRTDTWLERPEKAWLPAPEAGQAGFAGPAAGAQPA